MIVLIDTDILLDVALQRKPFFEDSAKIIDLVESNRIMGFVAWHSLSNFYYLISSPSGKVKTKQFLFDLLQFVNVSQTNTESAKKALFLNVPDFEDALQIVSAIECKADYIITRNLRHYKKSPITPLTPEIFLKKI